MDASVPLDTGTHSKMIQEVTFAIGFASHLATRSVEPSPEGRAEWMAQQEQIACRILVDRIRITGVQRALRDKNWKRVVFLTVNE